MGLDYTAGCVNFRDVGEYLELITGKSILPTGRLYRGGSIDHVKDIEEIGRPATIVNLRNGEDYEAFNMEYLHFPMANKVEKYDTGQKEVRQWLNRIVRTFESPALSYPVLIHCLSGKDRTGIVVAALLKILGFDNRVILEEYLLSDGEVLEDRIQLAINGMGDIEKYFSSVDLGLVKENILKA